MSEIRASIVMAVYNGEKYLAHQLDSIIPMMAENDELIITYDKSNDNTLNIVKSYEEKDSRIRVVINEGKRGIWTNSMNALKYVRGKYVIPSDQDDEWINDKINVVVSAFDNDEIMGVLHDGYVCDGDLNVIEPTIIARTQASNSWFKNFIKSTVAGCCFAYRSEIAKIMMETPLVPDAADQWNAICTMLLGEVKIIKPVLTKHRIHENNYTPKHRRKLPIVLYGRIRLAINILWFWIHERKYRRELFTRNVEEKQ